MTQNFDLKKQESDATILIEISSKYSEETGKNIQRKLVKNIQRNLAKKIQTNLKKS